LPSLSFSFAISGAFVRNSPGFPVGNAPAKLV
jgi:hypothetical protein